MALTRMEKRLTKDLEQIQKHYKDQFTVYNSFFDCVDNQVNLPNKDLKLWHIGFVGTKGSVYQGEKYTQSNLPKQINLVKQLQKVIFVGKSPDHEHIYSNGFICMSILYDGLFFYIYLKSEWSAALTVASVCMSIVSMLNSAKKKVDQMFFFYKYCSRGPLMMLNFAKDQLEKDPKPLSGYHSIIYLFIRTFDDDKA